MEEKGLSKGKNRMVWLLRRCVKCEKYTLNQEKCPYCGGRVQPPHPAKFSPDDKYAKYRRALRETSQNERNFRERKKEG